MLDKTRMRTLPVLNRAADFAPATQACCGICRTCTITNVLSLISAGAVAAGLYVTRLVRRAKPA